MPGIRKESVQTVLALFFALTLAAGCVSHAMQPFFPYTPPVSPVIASFGGRLPTIVIDAGHGGMDGGASGVTGVLERDVNLAVAQRTEALMTLFGLSCVMTRSDDADIAPGVDYKTIRSRKIADMRARAELVNAIPNAMLFSIHMNSYPDPRCSGSQVFYSPTAGSDLLAGYVRDALAAVTGDSSPRAAAPVNPGLYLYRTVTCPAVLIECGFLTNPEEEKRLASPEYQLKLAMGLTAAAMRALTSSDNCDTINTWD